MCHNWPRTYPLFVILITHIPSYILLENCSLFNSRLKWTKKGSIQKNYLTRIRVLPDLEKLIQKNQTSLPLAIFSVKIYSQRGNRRKLSRYFQFHSHKCQSHVLNYTFLTNYSPLQSSICENRSGKNQNQRGLFLSRAPFLVWRLEIY